MRHYGTVSYVDYTVSHLLANADGNITLTRVVDLAQHNEQAELNSKALKGTESSLKKLSLTT